MKNLILFLILVSSNIFSQNLKKHELLIPYREGKLWGLCDTLGVVKVKPFADDLISFKINDDFSGKYIIKQNGEISVIDEQKKILLKNSKYDSISIEYFDNAIEVYKDKKVGVFLNRKEFIPCNYDRINEVQNGSYEIIKGNLSGLINSEGKIIIPLKYKYLDVSDDENDFKNGNFTWIAKNNSRITKFYDKKIEIEEIGPPLRRKSEVYEEISNPDSVKVYNQKISDIYKNYHINSIVDKKFAIVTKREDNNQQENESGIIRISDNKIILEIKYVGVSYVVLEKGIHIFVYNDRKYGQKDKETFIDENGKIILKDLDDTFNYQESIYFIKKDEKWGVKIFNTVYDYIPPKYKSINLSNSFRINESWGFNLFRIETIDGKIGYVGENGVEYFKD